MNYRPSSVFPETPPVTQPLVANAAPDAAAEPRRFGILASCVVTGAILAAVGSQFENPLLDPGVETLLPAVEQVEANYVRPVSRKELLESALKGMLQELDPHSSFINTSEWKQFRRQIEGRFGGIGIQVGMDGEAKRLKVIAPMVGTPATSCCTSALAWRRTGGRPMLSENRLAMTPPLPPWRARATDIALRSA